MKIEALEAHALWATLDAAAETLRLVDETADLAAIQVADDYRELMSITRRIPDGEVSLVTQPQLDSVHQLWNQVNAHLTNFANNSDPNQLARAVAQGDPLRTLLSAFPRALAHGSAQASVTRALNRFLTDLDESRERLIVRQDEALAATEAREVALEARVAELTAEVEAARASLDSLGTRIAADETRLAEALTSNNETFIQGQTSRDKDFKAWLVEREKAFGKLAAPHLQSIEAAGNEAQASLAEVNSLRTDTVELAGLAAGDILAEKYGAYASSERRSAYIAYGFGLVAAAAGIAIVLWAFGPVEPGIQWELVVLKFGLTVAAGGVAAVAFRFGGQALRRATSFKRQELELRALQPFLKDVQGADLAKTAFLGRAFGHAWTEPTAKGGEGEVSDTLLKLLTALVQNGAKQGGSSAT